MEFESPRFAGDPVLEEILNDPDTGTKKLQSGSPPESVMKVQGALWDLWWPNRAEPPIDLASPEGFVDGDFGEGTQRTVLRYKRQYDIHFPPDAPTGFVDGLVGPRTLAALDSHSVLFDELDAAIEAKFAELSAATGAASTGRSFPVLGSEGLGRVVTVDGASFHIYAKRGLGAFAVGDPISAAYVFQYGGPTGRFGWPVDDGRDEAPDIRSQDFEFGSLRAAPPSGLAEPVAPTPPIQAPF